MSLSLSIYVSFNVYIRKSVSEIYRQIEKERKGDILE